MNRSTCPISGKANTFVVDSYGNWEIRLCIPCAEKELFVIDISNAVKCNSCGELFIKKKSSVCPCCWKDHFAKQNKPKPRGGWF